jgi:transglutaminase-like putative cysteine protease
MRRNDSYTVQVHVPKPLPAQLENANSGELERQDDMRVVTVPFLPGERAPLGIIGRRDQRPDPLREAEVHFAAWGSDGQSFADYPSVNRSEYDVDEVMKRSVYAETWALSKLLRRGAAEPMDYIRAVSAHLRRPEFRYTEKPPQPPFGQAQLEFFLNTSHRGYCQHFAGAMALLLRMGGLPARVATGFSPGGYSERHKAWIVRDTDAHAWVEVWFDEYGWVTVDPTPAATPARSLVAALAAPPSASASVPDLGTGGNPATGEEGTQPSVRPELLVGSSDGTTSAGAGRSWRWLLWLALGLAAVSLVLSVALFIRRPRGDTPMDRAIAEVENAMRRVGRPVTTGTTLGQLEERFGSYSPEVAAYLRALARARYGVGWTPPPPGGRRALRRALADGLGFGGGLRALWAMPPRIERQRSRVLEVETSVRG